MANIPIPENDDSLELNVRYQPDMVLEGMLDATVPEFKRLTLTMGNEVYDLASGGSSLPDIGENDEGKVLMVVEEDDELVPAWGSAALPEITEQDMGKVLTAGEGEPIWADAPSGLPEIGENDEGKVLTVYEKQEEITIVPEQTVTLEDAGGGMFMASLTGVTVTVSDFEEGDPATVTVDDVDYPSTFQSLGDGMSGFAVLGANVALAYSESTGWVLGGSSALTMTVSATAEQPSGEFDATWEPTLTYKVYKLVYSATYDKMIVENGMGFVEDVWLHNPCVLVYEENFRRFDLIPLCSANSMIYVFGIDPFDSFTTYKDPKTHRLLQYTEPGEEHYVYWDYDFNSNG